MKKLSKALVALALTLVMLTGNSISAFAGSSVVVGEGTNNASVPIELDIGPAYVVSLPAVITLTKRAFPEDVNSGGYYNNERVAIPTGGVATAIEQLDGGATDAELFNMYKNAGVYSGYYGIINCSVAANLLEGETLYVAFDAYGLEQVYADDEVAIIDDYTFYKTLVHTHRSGSTVSYNIGLDPYRGMTASKTEGNDGENSNYMMFEFDKSSVAKCAITDGLPVATNYTSFEFAFGLDDGDIDKYESFTTDLIVRFGLNEMPDLMH